MVFHLPQIIISKLSSIYVVNTVLRDINPEAQPFLSKEESCVCINLFHLNQWLMTNLTAFTEDSFVKARK